MSHEIREALARLHKTALFVESEIERLETLAPTLEEHAHSKAINMANRLRAQAAAIRGQVRALEAQL